MSGERQSVVVVDDLGQCLAVRLIADMPVGDPAQSRQGRAGAGVRHSVQPQVDCVGEDGGQEQCPILRWAAVTKMDEVPGKTRPLVHFHQQFGDLDAREHHGGLPGQGVGFGQHHVGQGRYPQNAIGQ